MKRTACVWLVFLALSVAASGCLISEDAQPSSTPADESPHGPTPSATIEPTSSPTQEILYTPTLRYTPDSQMQTNLQDAGDLVLTHGIILQFSPSASFAEACPGFYMAVAPYRTTRGVFSFALFRAPVASNGEVDRVQLEYLWNWLWEGIFPHEYGQIRSLEVIEGWPLMLQWVAQWPGTEWDTGLAFGECPGDEFAMIGLFRIQDPDEFELRVTRYDDQAPFDFWLHENGTLTQYHYEDFEPEPLWILDDTPGRMVTVYWDDGSPDFNNDGRPDLVVVWSIDGSDTPMGYLRQDNGFIEHGLVKYP